VISKERLFSSIQYATGWLLILTFGYGFVLPLFVNQLPTVPLIFPVLVLTFSPTRCWECVPPLVDTASGGTGWIGFS